MAADNDFYLATVVDVDYDKGTVWVQGDLTQKDAFEVPYSVPYCSSSSSGGIYFQPEIGSVCYLFESSDGTKFVGAWLNGPQRSKDWADHDGVVISGSAGDAPDFTGQRESLEPGDIYLGTAEGNRVFIRKGGVVEVSSTPLCGRMYIPVENLVQDYFQRYRADSPLGSVEWGHASLFSQESLSRNFDEDSGVPVSVRYNIKSNIKDDVRNGRNHTVEVRLGDVSSSNIDASTDSDHIFGNGLSEDFIGGGANESGVLSVSISDPSSGQVTYSFQVGRNGENAIVCKGGMHIEVSGGIYVKSQDGAKMVFGNNSSAVEAGAGGDLSADVRVLDLSSETSIMVSAGTQIVLTVGPQGSISLGEGAMDSAVTWTGLVAYLAELMTTNQLVPPSNLQPVAFKSNKVKLL